MIEPECDWCGSDLREPGALVFSPPHFTHSAPGVPVTVVEKFHICVPCWKTEFPTLRKS